jgi:hypothetical protein
MRLVKLTEVQQHALSNQKITAEQPGSVLHDFEMLLDFLGTDGVEAAGKYNLIPIKVIGELDRRLSRPLHLELKRPQIRSHPYLQALNLLLRASGLGRVEGSADKARLSIDPAMKIQWDQLNFTERYFNLLEAAFRFGRAEMVGEQSRDPDGLLWPCLMDWRHCPESGKKFATGRPQEIYLLSIGRNWYLLALMDLFGVMDVEQPHVPVTTWFPAGIRRVPFGDAVMTLITPKRLACLYDETEEKEEDSAELPQDSFGIWQPLFQPFFPEWGQNLEFPSQELRDGMFIFRVSLDKVWRLIAMPSEGTLEDLADWILGSVGFDRDHLYEFIYRDRLGAESRIHHPGMDEGPWADEIDVGELPLAPGRTMTFRYDFGDNWKFEVKLERVDPRGKQKRPRILERHGKPPRQYGDWDE